MNDSNTIVSKLENALNIKLEILEKLGRGTEISGNSCTPYVSRLCLSHIHFEDFSALESVFDRVEHLKLIECSIADIQDLQKIKLKSLTLNKCSLPDKGTFNPEITKINENNYRFDFFTLENMDIPHPGFFLPISNSLEYLKFNNCTIHNISELNLFPDLYRLTIGNNTNIIESKNDIYYPPKKDKRATGIDFKNMKIKDFNSFLPISTGLFLISLYNCEVESLKSICQFPDFEKFNIHPPLQVNDLSIPDDGKQFELECMIVPEQMSDYHYKDWVSPDFNTELLASIAPYTRELIVFGYNLINVHILKGFEILNNLFFNKSSIDDLDDYSLVAPKIKEVTFFSTKIKNQKAFRYFTKLNEITISSNYYDRTYIDLKKLLPLKEHLKKINIYEKKAVRNMKELKHFTALEQIHTSADSVELAQDILSIESLKDLYLNIHEQTKETERPIVLDVQRLKNVEKLDLDANDDVYFKGMSHLKSLKILELDDDGDLEELAALPSLEKLVIREEVINKFPEMKQVKVLDLHVPRNYEPSSLEKFPNLEKLKLNIFSGQKIAIKGLEKLKIIVFEFTGLDDVVSFENLPSLEEVDLTECGVSNLSKLKNLHNLKKLNLEKNNIESLEGIENLKNLEELAFYLGDITDLTPLNKLPNLRKLFIWDKKKEDIEVLLDRPEILIRHDDTFRISIEEENEN